MSAISFKNLYPNLANRCSTHEKWKRTNWLNSKPLKTIYLHQRLHAINWSPYLFFHYHGNTVSTRPIMTPPLHHQQSWRILLQHQTGGYYKPTDLFTNTNLHIIPLQYQELDFCPSYGQYCCLCLIYNGLGSPYELAERVQVDVRCHWWGWRTREMDPMCSWIWFPRCSSSQSQVSSCKLAVAINAQRRS